MTKCECKNLSESNYGLYKVCRDCGNVFVDGEIVEMRRMHLNPINHNIYQKVACVEVLQLRLLLQQFQI